jgi:hypothetical protein
VSAQPNADADRIARRYPPSRTPRWLWLAGVAVIVVVGGAWLIWSALYGANPPISARVVSFTVTSDQTMDVRVTTQRPDPQRAGRVHLHRPGSHLRHGRAVRPRAAARRPELEDHDLTIRTFKRATSVKIENSLSLLPRTARCSRSTR